MQPLAESVSPIPPLPPPPATTLSIPLHVHPRFPHSPTSPLFLLNLVWLSCLIEPQPPDAYAHTSSSTSTHTHAHIHPRTRTHLLSSKAAAKLGNRATAEGRIGVAVAGQTAGVAEISCETDFVARTDTVDALVASLAAAAIEAAPAGLGEVAVDVEALLTRENGALAEDLKAAIAAVGENIVVRRAGAFTVDSGVQVGTYIHGIGTYAAVVGVAGTTGDAAAQFAGKVAQHVVAMDPGEGGVDGLLDTPFLFDGDKTVREATAAEAGGATVTGYLRWAIAKVEG